MSNPLDEIMKQAQLLQEKIGKNAEDMLHKQFIGEAGAGLVKITLNGQRQAVKVAIDPSVFNEDKQVLEDLILAAINHGLTKVDSSNQFSISELAKQMNLKDLLTPGKK